MSFSIDTNILLYASDLDSPFHAKAKTFLEKCWRGPEMFFLTWPTIMSYVRIATHPSIFKTPLSPREALSNVKALAAPGHVRFLSEKEGFLDAYEALTASNPVRGILVPDAHLAALLHQHGVRTLYTNDADFRRFPSLNVRNPFRNAH